MNAIDWESCFRRPPVKGGASGFCERGVGFYFFVELRTLTPSLDSRSAAVSRLPSQGGKL
jgi:hypothetical protein